MSSKAVRNVIWVASYPRSGNTWLRSIIASCFGESRVGLKHLRHDRRFLKSDFKELTPIEIRGEQFYFLKTHMLPFETYSYPLSIGSRLRTRGFVYVYRHPLDVFVSSLNFMYHRKRKEILFNGDLKLGSIDELVKAGRLSPYADAFLEDMRIGRGAFWEMCGGNWLNHVNTWLAMHASGKLPSVKLRYEDMLAKPERTLLPLCDYLDVSINDLTNAIDVANEDTKRDGKFFWKRNSENYRAYLDEKIIRKFESKYGKVLNDLGF